MFCMNCGQELPIDAIFCSSCGKEAAQTSAKVRTPIIDQSRTTAPQGSTPSSVSKLVKLAGSAIFWIVALIASVIGGIAGKALLKGGIRGTSTADTQSYSMPVEQMPVQRVDSFSVKYAFPFLRNEKRSRDMMAAVEAQAPGFVHSLDVLTSRPSCGVGEAQLIVATYAQGTQLSIDGAANRSVNGISALSGVTSPENIITPAIVSGYPARRISYRAKRWDGVLGYESITIADLQTNTLWQLQLILSARNTSDYTSLNSAQLCARKILESVAIGATP